MTSKGDDDDSSATAKDTRAAVVVPNGKDKIIQNGKASAAPDEEEETEQEYRLRVYGTVSPYDDELDHTHDKNNNKKKDPKNGTYATQQRPSLMRQFSRRVSSEWDRRRRSSLKEQLPQTPYGWAVFLSTLSTLTLRYELGVQKSLTCPPLVYGQIKQGPLKEIHKEMTKSDKSILVRAKRHCTLEQCFCVRFCIHRCSAS